MYGKTIKDQIPNNIVCAQLLVIQIEEKMREHQLHWFGHLDICNDIIQILHYSASVLEDDTVILPVY